MWDSEIVKIHCLRSIAGSWDFILPCEGNLPASVETIEVDEARNQAFGQLKLSISSDSMLNWPTAGSRVFWEKSQMARSCMKIERAHHWVIPLPGGRWSYSIAGNPPRKCANPGHLSLGGWHKSRIVHKRHSQHHNNKAKPLWTFYHCLRQLQTPQESSPVDVIKINTWVHGFVEIPKNAQICFNRWRYYFFCMVILMILLCFHMFLCFHCFRFICKWLIPYHFQKRSTKNNGKTNPTPATWSKIHSRPRRVKEASTASKVLARS